MILTCPSCRTRYLVDGDALGGAAGRRVRCASCGNLWRYSPGTAAIQAAAAEVAAAVEAATPAAAPEPPPPAAYKLRAEPDVETLRYPPGPSVQGRPSVVVERPAARFRRAAVAGLAAVGVAAVLAAAVVERDSIMALWPSAAQAVADMHLGGPPGAGLGLTSTLTRSDGSLVVAGDIVNNTAAPRPVPQLRLTLRDGLRRDLASQVIAPPQARLMPGASEHFTGVFDHPSNAATGVTVEFATD